MRSEWTYTIPITRATEDASGTKYLIGEASGPERDTHGTQMAPEAIIDFQRQIIERAQAGDPIPYKDSHGRGVGVLQDLGWVVDAAVTPDFHLIIRVALDDTNPAALFLHNSIQRGKQYGMSVKGNVQNFVYEKAADGGRMMKFLKVALEEISNTTKPSWVPSFGTVLARSVEGEQGVTDMEENLDATAARDEQAPVDESSSVELDAGAEPVVENAADDVDNTTEDTAEESVERGLSQSARAELAAAYKTLTDQMVALGVITAPENTATQTPTPETTEAARDTSETGDDEGQRTDTVEFNGIAISRDLATAIEAAVTAAVQPLNEALAERDARIEELQNLPAGQVPGIVAREKFSSPADDFSEQLSRMSPDERLRYALAKAYEGH